MIAPVPVPIPRAVQVIEKAWSGYAKIAACSIHRHATVCAVTVEGETEATEDFPAIKFDFDFRVEVYRNAHGKLIMREREL